MTARLPSILAELRLKVIDSANAARIVEGTKMPSVSN
jgi:hypothetical protein